LTAFSFALNLIILIQSVCEMPHLVSYHSDIFPATDVIK